MTTQRVGIYGGAFDPLHAGHIAVAEAATEEFTLDTLIWVPTGNPPHKKTLHSSFKQRSQALQNKIQSYANWYISDIENTDKPSYTSDTLQALCTDKESTYITIIGADQALALTQWHDLDTILSLSHIAIAPRDNIALPECLAPSLQQRWHSDTNALDKTTGYLLPISMIPVDLHSTELRNPKT